MRHDRRPWAEEALIFLKIGIPMGLTQLIQFSFHLVDMLMVARLGATYVAAASMAGSMWLLSFLICIGPAAAVSPLVAQALGANPNDRDDVRLSVRMGHWAVLMIFPAAIMLLMSTEWIVLALGQPEDLAAMAGPFALTLAATLPFGLSTLMLRNFLAALGKTQIPLLIIIASAVLNAVLNYALIYGNWGAPRLELVGAGIASVLAEAVKWLAILAYIHWDRAARHFAPFRDALTPDWDRLKEVLRLGWPIGVDVALWNGLSIAALFVMGLIGVAEMAAYNVARNSVAGFIVMFPLGLSMAGGVRVGLAAGAGDWPRVRRAAAIMIVAGLACASVLALPCLLMPEAVGRIYLDADDALNREVLALIGVFLPIASLFVLLDVMQFSLAGSLRALKDVRVPMVLSGISYWLIGFPAAAGLGLATQAGAYGVWGGLLLGLLTASSLLACRLWVKTRPWDLWPRLPGPRTGLKAKADLTAA